MEWKVAQGTEGHCIMCDYGKYYAAIDWLGKKRYHCWIAKNDRMKFSVCSKLPIAELKRRLENKLIKYTFDENNVVSN